MFEFFGKNKTMLWMRLQFGGRQKAGWKGICSDAENRSEFL